MSKIFTLAFYISGHVSRKIKGLGSFPGLVHGRKPNASTAKGEINANQFFIWEQ